MTRYGTEHKVATRQRIIETAARRFKQDGIDGSGIAALMGDAGLTNGAFYAHFASKEELVATVVGEQVGRQAASFADLPYGPAGLETFVHDYLSAQHRDHPEDGCPSAALLDEIGRCSRATKDAYTAGAEKILEEIRVRLASQDADLARQTAVSLYSMMVGTMQLARAISDPKLSDAVLAQGVGSAMRLLAGTASA